jgi:hypothetical protein
MEEGLATVEVGLELPEQLVQLEIGEAAEARAPQGVEQVIAVNLLGQVRSELDLLQ